MITLELGNPEKAHRLFGEFRARTPAFNLVTTIQTLSNRDPAERERTAAALTKLEAEWNAATA